MIPFIAQIQKVISGVYKATEQAIAIGNPTNAALKVTTTTLGAQEGLDVNVAGFAGGTIVVSPVPALSRTPTAVAVGAAGTSLCAADANRIKIWFYNNSPQTIFIGPTGTAVGLAFPLPAGMPKDVGVDEGAALEWTGIVTAGTREMRVMQFFKV